MARGTVLFTNLEHALVCIADVGCGYEIIIYITEENVRQKYTYIYMHTQKKS